MKKKTTKTRAAGSKPKKIAVFQTSADLKVALLVVSLAINLFTFCIWLTLQITSRYDVALYNFFVFR